MPPSSPTLFSCHCLNVKVYVTSSIECPLQRTVAGIDDEKNRLAVGSGSTGRSNDYGTAHTEPSTGKRSNQIETHNVDAVNEAGIFTENEIRSLDSLVSSVETGISETDEGVRHKGIFKEEKCMKVQIDKLRGIIVELRHLTKIFVTNFKSDKTVESYLHLVCVNCNNWVYSVTKSKSSYADVDLKKLRTEGAVTEVQNIGENYQPSSVLVPRNGCWIAQGLLSGKDIEVLKHKPSFSKPFNLLLPPALSTSSISKVPPSATDRGSRTPSPQRPFPELQAALSVLQTTYSRFVESETMATEAAVEEFRRNRYQQLQDTINQTASDRDIIWNRIVKLHTLSLSTSPKQNSFTSASASRRSSSGSTDRIGPTSQNLKSPFPPPPNVDQISLQFRRRPAAGAAFSTDSTQGHSHLPTNIGQSYQAAEIERYLSQTLAPLVGVSGEVDMQDDLPESLNLRGIKEVMNERIAAQEKNSTVQQEDQAKKERSDDVSGIFELDDVDRSTAIRIESDNESLPSELPETSAEQDTGNGKKSSADSLSATSKDDDNESNTFVTNAGTSMFATSLPISIPSAAHRRRTARKADAKPTKNEVTRNQSNPDHNQTTSEVISQEEEAVDLEGVEGDLDDTLSTDEEMIPPHEYIARTYNASGEFLVGSKPEQKRFSVAI
ncbi:hypothetical protein BKA69DRAFT_1073253 [Paraphysoderma sedebokerense]|nr:hypothetical protein BKA69DRAFT_1073253 [Paraphysoderma sedebokerense]